MARTMTNQEVKELQEHYDRYNKPGPPWLGFRAVVLAVLLTIAALQFVTRRVTEVPLTWTCNGSTLDVVPVTKRLPL